MGEGQGLSVAEWKKLANFIVDSRRDGTISCVEHLDSMLNIRTERFDKVVIWYLPFGEDKILGKMFTSYTSAFNFVNKTMRGSQHV